MLFRILNLIWPLAVLTGDRKNMAFFIRTCMAVWPGEKRVAVLPWTGRKAGFHCVYTSLSETEIAFLKPVKLSYQL